jgi:hypothetical protein
MAFQSNGHRVELNAHDAREDRVRNLLTGTHGHQQYFHRFWAGIVATEMGRLIHDKRGKLRTNAEHCVRSTRRTSALNVARAVAGFFLTNSAVA